MKSLIPHRRDTGSITVWMCGLCAISILVLQGLAILGQATFIKAQTQNAADAAALSAAYEVANYKSSRACSSAREAAEKNNATLTQCDVLDEEVYVEVKHTKKNISAHARAEID